MQARVRRAGRRGGDVKLSLTPMIDVVFLLLIFFVLAIKPRDLLAGLEVARPAAGGCGDVPPVCIDVWNGAYSLNGRRVGYEQLGRLLARLKAFGAPPVVVTCSGDSNHAQLVRVLDLCAEHELPRVALFSR